MRKTQGTSIFIIGAALVLGGLAGCGLDDADTGPNDEPDELGLLCSAELPLSGTLVPAGEPPGPDDGCLPQGTWTVNVDLSNTGDCGTLPVEAQYVYEVSGGPGEGGFLVNYPADPDNESNFLKISGQGPSCAGNFEHYLEDDHALLLLKPFEDDLVLTGTATFELYDRPQL